ncbi:MAG: SOS response-associated peptidase [Cytophagales bacterium]|nr:SOS response-associated peptidase [Cytophagales bacterium]
MGNISSLDFLFTFYSKNQTKHVFLQYAQDRRDTIQPFTWGMIPHFANMEWGLDKIRSRNLNARDDKVFELNTWKGPIESQRCLVVLDAFYEYHHHADTKTRVPYHISMADKGSMTLAGLWDIWIDRDSDITRSTVTIVTTLANDIMKSIHNNPAVIKRGSHRMPLVLTRDTEKQWLEIDATNKAGQDQLIELMAPLPSGELNYYQVSTIQGKNGTDNSEQTIEKYDWPLIGLP